MSAILNLIKLKLKVEIALTRKFVDRKKSQGQRKVKCEISQALVMINMYVKFMCIPLTKL